LLLADVFITHHLGGKKMGKPFERERLFNRCFESYCENTPRELVRTTLIYDGVDTCTGVAIDRRVDHLLVHRQNAGLGPSINQALAYIDILKKWDEGMGGFSPPFTVYLQDDVLCTPGWLERLTKMFLLLEKQHNLGFVTGAECPEHPIKKDLGNGLLLKDMIRATCMVARHEYWMSMWPLPRLDPETGRERGRPNDGLGSSCDLWFMRNHENSVLKSGRTNLIIPGVLQHAGYAQSTWLARELPESEADKKVMRKEALTELVRLTEEYGGYDDEW
jgi:hypothetical protein